MKSIITNNTFHPNIIYKGHKGRIVEYGDPESIAGSVSWELNHVDEVLIELDTGMRLWVDEEQLDFACDVLEEK